MMAFVIKLTLDTVATLGILGLLNYTCLTIMYVAQSRRQALTPVISVVDSQKEGGDKVFFKKDLLAYCI